MAVHQHPLLVDALLQNPPTEPPEAVGEPSMPIFVRGAALPSSVEAQDHGTLCFTITASTTVARFACA